MTETEQFAEAVSMLPESSRIYARGVLDGLLAREASGNELHEFNAEQATVPLPNEQKTADEA